MISSAGRWHLLPFTMAASVALVGSSLLWRAGSADEADSPPADELRRQGFLGAALEPGPDGEPPRVREVLPDTAAEAAGLAGGDVILAVDDSPVADLPGLLALLRSKREGDVITLLLRRDGEELAEEVTLKSRTPERPPSGELIFGSVAAEAGRHRTITVKPEGDGPFPAFFLIQGLGCFSVESTDPTGSYARILDAFAQAGYVTFRVEKPGCGDSEGGPCEDADFDAELDGYRQGLKALKEMPFVDPDRVVIFGHSMGGVMAPLIAADDPVAGIAVYGTVLKTWYEYLLENFRRQAMLAGADFEEVDELIRGQAELFARLLFLGQDPEQIVRERPDLAPRLLDLAPDGEHIFTRNAAFFRQLAAQNLPAAWKATDADALAIWGEADYVSTREDHALIADLVNREHDGRGRFLSLEGTDHGFERADSFEDAQARQGPGTFNEELIRELLGWADSVLDAGS